MQEPLPVLMKEVSNPKLKKKKPLTQRTSAVQKRAEIRRKEMPQPSLKMKKGSKSSLKHDISPPFQQTDRLAPDSLPDSLGPSSEYRALRHKYLLLEEENFSLGNELSEVEAEVKNLEDEKLTLLDKLVVLEGLVDPSECKPRGGM